MTTIKSTEWIVPNVFHTEHEDGDVILLMKVQGVSTQHLLYGSTNEKIMWYYVRPDSGPVEWLQRWASSHQEFRVFKYSEFGIDYWRAMDEAQHFVLRAASDEVLDEVLGV